MTDELKPCPFCGDIPGPDSFDFTDCSKWGAVMCCCNGPQVRTGYKKEGAWRDGARIAWNTRPIESRLERELAEAREARAALQAECGVLETELTAARAEVARLTALLERDRDLYDQRTADMADEIARLTEFVELLQKGWIKILDDFDAARAEAKGETT